MQSVVSLRLLSTVKMKSTPSSVGDSALRSVKWTETLFKAREHQIDLTFEVKEPAETLPIKLIRCGKNG